MKINPIIHQFRIACITHNLLLQLIVTCGNNIEAIAHQINHTLTQYVWGKPIAENHAAIVYIIMEKSCNNHSTKTLHKLSCTTSHATHYQARSSKSLAPILSHLIASLYCVFQSYGMTSLYR